MFRVIRLAQFLVGAALAPAVSAAVLQVSPLSLNFTCRQAGTTGSQNLSITSTGGSVSYIIGVPSGSNYVAAGPTNGTTPGNVTVSVSCAMAAGTYSGTISVSSPSAATVNVPVNLTITPLTSLSATPGSLNFGTWQIGTTAPSPIAISVQSANPPSGVAVTGSLGSGCGWLTLGNGSGSTSYNASASVNTGLTAGNYSCQITFAGGQTAAFATATLTVTNPAVTVSVSPSGLSLSAGQTASFAATVTGSSNTAVNWSISPAVGSISASGVYTAPPSPINTAQNITVTATSQADTTKSGTATVSLLPTPVAVSVAPASVALSAGQSATFTATVTGNTNTSVTWSISPAVGSISASGVYFAPPAPINSAQNITVRATSQADTTKSATATVSLAATPVTVSVAPANVALAAGQTATFTATVTGNTNIGVNWSISPGVGSISASGTYTAPPQINSAQTVTVTATSQADATKFATATVSLAQGPVSVSISPASVTLLPSQTQQFTATVTGSSNTAVTWSISPAVGGSITSSGLYTAPAGGPQTVTVTAASQADPTKFVSATVSVVASVSVSVSPASTSLTAGQTAAFAAAVTGTSNTTVTWSISPAVGGISASGVYTAPPSPINSAQTVTVRATSQADTTKSGTATVSLSATPVVVSVSPATVTLTAGQAWTFTATVTGNTNTGVNWSISPAVGGISASGVYIAPPAPINNAQTVTVTAISQADTTKSATATVSLSATTVSISVSPASASLTAGQTAAFTATVTGNTNTGVSWFISPAVGSISPSGVYTAPAAPINNAQTVTVTATSQADDTKSATAAISLAATPVSVSVSPPSATVTAGQTAAFTATVTGNSNTGVTWSISPAAGSISASGVYTAPSPVNSAQNVTVTATSQADTSKSASATVTLSPTVSVSVSPGSITVTASQTATFTAAVSGNSNTAVTWAISPAVGSISASGVYTAPSPINNAQNVIVTATSQADTSKSASATVTLSPTVSVSVSPGSITLTGGQTTTFTATVTGNANTAVTWSISPAVGSISASGIYTAPSPVNGAQSVTVTAVSQADTTKSASATVALVPVSVSVSPASASVSSGGTVNFSASVTGATNTAVTWSVSPALGSISAAGVFTAPSVINSAQTLTVTAISQADPGKSGSATLNLLSSPVSVSISPASATLAAGQTAAFTATVTGNSNTAVNWSISPAVGTISAGGVYTAPSPVNSAQTITVTAVSQADSTKSATATVSLSATPVSVSVSPPGATLTAGQTATFTATVTGNSNTAVTWSVSPAVGSISASGVYTAPSPVNSSQTVTVTATSQADTAKSATATVTLLPTVTVSVSPTNITVTAGQTAAFTATVTGNSNTAVAWSISPNVGSISASGVYTAPSPVSITQTVTVTATSQADTAKVATAVVTLSPTVSVSVTPGNVTLTGGQSTTFTATVTGNANTGVTWSISPAVGAISASGVYTAPSPVGNALTVTVTATSQADTSKSASATVTLNPSVSVTLTPSGVTLLANQTVTFTASVTGIANTAVTWSISPALGTISASGAYTAPFPVNGPQTVTVTATSQGDPTKFGIATVILTSSVSVTVAPPNVILTANQTQQFTASVTGSSDTGVTWTISPNVGSISGGGLYTAPLSISGTQTVTVTATSQTDPSKSAGVMLTLSPVSLSVSATAQGFSFATGGKLPAPQAITVNSSPSGVNFTVAIGPNCPWLSLDNPGGKTPATFTLSVDPTQVTPGAYACTVTVSALGANSQQVQVNLTVTATTLIVSPTILTFSYQLGGPAPAAQPFTVDSTNPAAGVSFTVTPGSSCGWLNLTPAGGTTQAAGHASVSATVNTTGLAANTSYPCTLSVGSANSSTTPQINATLSVAPSALTIAPSSLTFNIPVGSPTPVSKTISVTGPVAGSVTVSVGPGSTWLKVNPASGSTPLSLTVTADPTGLTAGSYSGTILVNGNAVNVSLVVSQLPSLTAAPSPLSFRVQAGAAAPAPITVSIFTSDGSAVTITPSASSNGNWLSAAALAGQNVSVSIKPAGLQPGQYAGMVTVVAAPATNPNQVQIPVALTIDPPPPPPPPQPALVISSNSLTFSLVPGGNSASSLITVSNTGGGTLTGTVSAASLNSWLSVSPGAFSIAGGTSQTLAVIATPSNLQAGTFVGQITFTNTASGQQTTVSATTVVSPTPQTIVLSQNALAFAGLANSPSPVAQTVSIANGGLGTMNFSLQTTTTDGAAWLTATPGSSGVAAGTPQTIQIAANSAGLMPADYFGTVGVASATAANSGQIISVRFTVFPAGTALGPQLQTGGVILTSIGGAQPVQFFNTSAAPVLYSAVTTTDDGGNWFSIDSTHGSLTSNATISVQPQFGNLSPGIHLGSLRILFADGTLRTVSVVGVVATSASASLSTYQTPTSELNSNAERPNATICSPVAVTFLSPAEGTRIASGSAFTIAMKATDACNAPVSFAVKQPVDFSNTGRIVFLNPSATAGVYTVDFTFDTPASGAETPVTLHSAPNAGVGPLVGTALAHVTVIPGKSVMMPAGGILNAGSFTGNSIIAPGSWIAIFGDNLGDGPTLAPSVPLGCGLGNAQVQIGGTCVPLNYVSNGQINAQVPYDLAANQQTQILVTHAGGQSVTQTLTIADALPAIFTTNSSGSGQGAITTPGGAVLKPGNPARAGDIVVIYCTGLGPTTPQVKLGEASPVPLAVVTSPVSVTIGGVPAKVAFQGLTPGTVGLYQLNVEVPAGVAAGDAVPVVVSVSGKLSQPSVTMAIQ